jgi:6-phosphogluconolactonase
MSDAAPNAQPRFVEFANADEANDALATEIVARLTDSVAQRRRASLVVSGGTTPGALFDVLAHRAAPWKDVIVTVSDERWVDPHSVRSNENLVRSRLLVANAAPATFVPLKAGAASAQEAEGEVGAAIAAMPRPFDIVLLGMGGDGHTASLIPGSDGLARALDRSDPALVRAIDPPDVTGMGPRITLTLRALLDARWIALLIRGEDKLAAFRQASAGTDVRAAPVRAILQQTAVPVAVYWSP